MSTEYRQSATEIFSTHNSSENGLSTSIAEQRLSQFGLNKLDEAPEKTLLAKIWEQIKDPMITVLIAAAILSAAFQEYADTVIILVVVVVNTILGIYQEGKADDAIKALQKSSAPHSRVRRDGKILDIESDHIVVGDIVILEAGDVVPADLRLFHTASLKVEEAALTGESVPVEKHTDTLVPDNHDEELNLGDRSNMVYRGTSVTYGRGEGVVVATGMKTEMGKIASMITNVDIELTPLQKKLAQLSKVLSVAVVGICVFIFVFMVIRQGSLNPENIFEALLIAVSLAVAAIPEGLVVVVTVLLSIGVTKMSKKKAIVRRLTAVETLGCTQVICSDKTGTLTQNKMTVVEEKGDEKSLALAVLLCNDATGDVDGGLIGDPTETALLTYGLRFYDKEVLRACKRVAEIPFDSERKMMTTFNEVENEYVQFTKGAPDEIIKRCTHILRNGELNDLTDEYQAEINNDNKQMANKALRVLAGAMRKRDSIPTNPTSDEHESDLVFLGLVGLIDPIRSEAKDAIKMCKQAGIKVVMITGDHQDTAIAIGKDLGIVSDSSQVMTGSQLQKLTDSQFRSRIDSISVYARVQPEDKVRIVKTWQDEGKVTAMTGDGVNDAPALKVADIGIGMSITGTEVSKSVSDMILVDDNFATIVSAVDEGRRIYDNIKKVIQFLLASNLSEVLAIFLATIFGWKIFSPIHVLWINLITDTFPALALGMEEGEDAMNKPPRDPNESIFAGGLGLDILWQGSVIGLLTLSSFMIGALQNQLFGMTMAFVTLSMCEIFHAMNMRSRTKSIFRLENHNKYLWMAMLASFILTMLVVYIPGLNTVFHLAAIPFLDFIIAMGISFSIIPIVETIKFLKRKKD